VAIALTAMLFARGEAVEKTRERDWLQAFYRRRAQHDLVNRQEAPGRPVTDSVAAPTRSPR
jgi:hypothetical protein